MAGGSHERGWWHDSFEALFQNELTNTKGLMKLDDLTSEAIGPYVFRYIVGMLWIAALGPFVLSTIKVQDVIHALNELIQELPSVRLPDLALVLITVAVGVIFPLAVATICEPISLFLANRLLSWQRYTDRAMTALGDRFLTWLYNVGSAASQSRWGQFLLRRVASLRAKRSAWRAAVRQETRRVVAKKLGAYVPLSNRVLLSLLGEVKPVVAAGFRPAFREISFRVGAILPSSLIVAEVVTRLLQHASTAHSRAFGAITGALAFILTGWSTNSFFDGLNDDLSISLLLFLERDATSKVPSAPISNEPDPHGVTYLPGNEDADDR
jgi:hypothetical protein